MNVSVLCRTCMKELEVKELEHVDQRAIKMYNYCTKIVFDELNELPKHFCSECSIKIKSTFTFIRKAQAVNETLKKFIFAINQPDYETNKLEPPLNEVILGTNNNNNNNKDPRTELEQAIHYLGTKYDLESAIDDADEAVDSFFKSLEESAPIIGESTTEEKTETDEINHIYNFVAPLFIEKTNEENDLLNVTPNTDTNNIMKTNIEPTTVTGNSQDLKDDNAAQNCTTTLPDIDPNMIIIVPHITAPYDEHAADPIAISNDTNANNITVADETSQISDKNDKTTKCPVCNKSFPEDDELALQEHMLIDHPDDPDEYAELDKTATEIATRVYPAKCELCAKIFNSATWYNKHMAKQHNNKIFKCEDCNKVYISYASWREHKKIHAGHMNCICPVCNKHFRKSSQLAEHVVIHSEERPFECPQCYKRFKLKTVLSNHMKTHSNKRKTILCDYCGRSFVTVRGLKEHMVRHTGSKPFECTECDFRAQYRATLIRHKLRHTLYRPHECKHCRKSFYNSDELRRHVRSHTGERPYKCPYCTRTFAEHNKRKAHLVNHHQLIFEEIPRLNRDGTPYVEEFPGITESSPVIIDMQPPPENIN